MKRIKRGKMDCLQIEGASFDKNAQGISKIFHELSLITNFLQTKT